MTNTPTYVLVGDLVLEGLTVPEQSRISRQAWLHTGFFPADDFPPELKKVRQEHVRLIETLHVAIAAYKTLTASFKEQDERHRQALLEAAMTGAEPPADERADEADRAAMRAEATDRAVAVERALVQHMQKTVAIFRANEADWLTALRAQRDPLEAKRAEARRLMAEAHAEEHRLAQTGLWVQRMANDDGLGLAVPPGPDAPPVDQSVSIPPHAFERAPWEAENSAWLHDEDPVARRMRLIGENHDQVRTLTADELGGEAA